MRAPLPFWLRQCLRAFACPVYILLYLPLGMVAWSSFVPMTATGSAAHFLSGFTLAAYHTLMRDAEVGAALRRSLLLAFCSASLSTVLGTLLGYGLCRFRSRTATGWLSHLPSLVIYMPIIMPALVFGIAELIFFNFVYAHTGLLKAGLLTMAIAHVTFQVPYVTLTVFARLAGLDVNLFEAAQDLFANGWKSFFYLVLPLVRPALLGGFLLGITLSIDDFTISFFTSGPGSVTLPLYIYGAIARKGISGEINALGTLMIAVVVLLASLHALFTLLRSRHLRRSDEAVSPSNLAVNKGIA